MEQWAKSLVFDVTAQHDNDKKKFLLATIISFSHILSIVSEVDFKRPAVQVQQHVV